MIPLVVANDKTLMLGSIKSIKGSSIEDPFLIPIKCFMLTGKRSYSRKYHFAFEY